MKKKIITTTLAVALGLGVSPSLQPVQKASAQTVHQNNQSAVEAKADELIQLGKSLIGKAEYSTKEYKPTYPYKFSCATFIMYIFEKSGVDLATYNENYMMKQGTYVPRNQLQKGDLVFFDSNKSDNEPSDHVAMYIGDNKVIQMADPKQKIVITDMNSKPYYKENYLTARRVLPSLLPSNPATLEDQIIEDSYNLKDKVTMGTVNNESSKKFTGPGFVNYIYKTNGVQLGTTNIKEQMKLGTTVSRSQLKKGDLVFFNSEKGSKIPSIVAIYAGEQRLIIPNSNGINTRVLLVDYYDQHYITAKRVISKKEIPAKKPVLNTNKADQIVNFASNLIGKAKFGYTYNEKALTFTSAGFTYYVYQNHGIHLQSKMASQQAKVGQVIQKSNLKKGDLLFFSTNHQGKKITQTGIYLGNSQFISLFTNGKVEKESLNSTWAKKNYVTAKRVL